jgi:hypothetical protein
MSKPYVLLEVIGEPEGSLMLGFNNGASPAMSWPYFVGHILAVPPGWADAVIATGFAKLLSNPVE